MRANAVVLLALSAMALGSPFKLPFSNSFNKLLSGPGCRSKSVMDQKIIFNSGANRYSVFVPADSEAYTLGEIAEPQLKCVDESTSGGPCVSCGVKVDHIQILNAGTCEASIKDDQGTVRIFRIGGASDRLALGTPGRPETIRCWLSKKSTRAYRGASIGPLCPETNGSSVVLTVGAVNPHGFLMTVPADQKLYKVNTPDEELRCVGPLGDKYSMCLPCDQEINSIQISEQAHTCAFNVSSYPYHIFLDSKSTSTPYVLGKPGKLLEVMCGFTDIVEAVNRDLSATTVSHLGSRTMMTRNESVDTTCQKKQGDILIRTWVQGSEYHSYITPQIDDWKYWQTNDSQVGFLPANTRDASVDSECMHLSSHIDAALVEGPENAYCNVIRIGPNDTDYGSRALYAGFNETFDDNDKQRVMVAVFCDLWTGGARASQSLRTRPVTTAASTKNAA